MPAGYRPGDILAFHRRDPAGIAERAGPDGFEKGLAWGGRPARLMVRFSQDRAEAELALDGAAAIGPEASAAMVRRLLGLDQDVEGFARRFGSHPQLAPLLAQRPGLRVAVAATPFEALSWAVTGQQISLRAAICLRRRLIEAVGLRHSGGLLCYPEAAQVARLDEAALRGAGFSLAKARTLLALAQAVAAGELPLEQWLIDLPVDEVRRRLLAMRGVGPWTVDYALLRGFGWLGASLHGDVAVRRNLQTLLAAPDRIGEAQAAAWLAQFAPWQALAAAHLWALRPSLPES